MAKEQEQEMDASTFQAAFDAVPEEPELGVLLRHFCWAFRKTDRDAHSAMAAVNELLEMPLSYDAFLTRVVSRAGQGRDAGS